MTSNSKLFLEESSGLSDPIGSTRVLTTPKEFDELERAIKDCAAKVCTRLKLFQLIYAG